MDLRSGRELRCLIRYALPIMMTLAAQQAYSIVDTVIVARFCAENDLAVISAASTVFSFLYNVLTGLAVGVGINAGLQLGAGNDRYRRDLAVSAFRSFLLLGICIAGITMLFARPLLILLQVPDAILQKSVLVLRLYSLCLMFYAVTACATVQINAVGNSRTTLVIGLGCGGLNIVLDCIFVLVLHTDAIGTVWASLICQGLQAAVSVLLQRRTLPEGRGHFSGRSILDSLPLSGSAVLQNAAVNLALVFVQAQINARGISYMNGASVALLTFSLLNCCMNGYAQGVSGFLSVNWGAGLRGRVRRGTRCALGLGLGISLLTALILAAAIQPVAAAMLGRGDETALDFARAYCMGLLPFYACSMLSQLAGAHLRIRKYTGIFIPASLLYAAVTIGGTLVLGMADIRMISGAQTLARALEALVLGLYLLHIQRKKSPCSEEQGDG